MTLNDGSPTPKSGTGLYCQKEVKAARGVSTGQSLHRVVGPLLLRGLCQ